jgi:hypothetical protein
LAPVRGEIRRREPIPTGIPRFRRRRPDAQDAMLKIDTLVHVLVMTTDGTSHITAKPYK